MRIGASAGRLAAIVGLSIGLSIAGDPATTDALNYSLRIHDREAASYTVDLPVRHRGTLRVDVEWSGGRTLAFRIEGPGASVRSRRAGPSPQQLEAEVTESDLGSQGSWTLFVHSLSDRGEIDGMLTITLPASPKREELTPAKAAKGARAFPQDPWMVPDVAPRGTDDSVSRVFESSETLRSWIVDAEGTTRSDACGWQSSLLRYLASRRAALKNGQAGVDEATARFLLQVARAIELVEELRSSDDPLLAGPVPEDEMEKTAWLSVRKRQIEPIEDELDALGTMMRRNHAPELGDETWPQRLVGCLTACERYFRKRALLGADETPNVNLAADQWGGILAAAGALEALATTDIEPTVVVGESSSAP